MQGVSGEMNSTGCCRGNELYVGRTFLRLHYIGITTNSVGC
jgi:hypothetical protein